MGDVVRIRDYQETCHNCRFEKLRPGISEPICTRPGGWHFDAEFKRCIDFRWKEEARNGKP